MVHWAGLSIGDLSSGGGFWGFARALALDEKAACPGGPRGEGRVRVARVTAPRRQVRGNPHPPLVTHGARVVVDGGDWLPRLGGLGCRDLLIRAIPAKRSDLFDAVSYTHLTLPTSDLV